MGLFAAIGSGLKLIWDILVALFVIWVLQLMFCTPEAKREREQRKRDKRNLKKMDELMSKHDPWFWW